MHNRESLLENETHKILWDIEIQTDHLISARRPDFVIVPAEYKIKIKKGKRDRYCWDVDKRKTRAVK